MGVHVCFCLHMLQGIKYIFLPFSFFFSFFCCRLCMVKRDRIWLLRDRPWSSHMANKYLNWFMVHMTQNVFFPHFGYFACDAGKYPKNMLNEWGSSGKYVIDHSWLMCASNATNPNIELQIKHGCLSNINNEQNNLVPRLQTPQCLYIYIIRSVTHFAPLNSHSGCSNDSKKKDGAKLLSSAKRTQTMRILMTISDFNFKSLVKYC